MPHTVRVSKFITEKETEQALENVTRVLEMPDGSRESVTTFRTFWTLNDLIIQTNCLTQEEIIRLSWKQVQIDKVQFVKGFECVIGYTHRCLKKIEIRK